MHERRRRPRRRDLRAAGGRARGRGEAARHLAPDEAAPDRRYEHGAARRDVGAVEAAGMDDRNGTGNGAAEVAAGAAKAVIVSAGRAGAGAAAGRRCDLRSRSGNRVDPHRRRSAAAARVPDRTAARRG